MKKRKKLMIWINTLPAMILIGAIIVFPILYTAYISFTNMNLFHWNDYKFVGIENYVRALFKVDAGFLSAILNNIMDYFKHGNSGSGCVFYCPGTEYAGT